MNWFRTYNEIIDDPKVLRLSYEFRWFFVALLAISSRQKDRGSLPDLKEISIGLRITKGKAARVIERFVDMEFIDVNPEDGSLSIHAWHKRQFQSDDITARTAAAKERARERSQELNGHGSRNGPLAGAHDRSQSTENSKDLLPSSEPSPDRSKGGKRACSQVADKPAIPTDPALLRIAAEDERIRRHNQGLS